MRLYELINSSDPYTFYASSLEVAGACACLLSSGFGARDVSDESQRTPILFGWDEWLENRGINETWLDSHAKEIADAFDSFLIGSPKNRADVESMLEMLTEDKRKQWRDDRQNRNRSSLSRIGEAAYEYAEKFRNLENINKSQDGASN